MTRFSFWWVIVGMTGLILFALGGVWYGGQSALDSHLSILKGQGLPTTAREINDYYVVPEGTADTTELWVAAIDAVRGARLDVRGSTLPIVGNGPAPVPAPGEAWAELDQVRAFVGELEPERQTILHAAKAGGQARFPVDFSAGINTLLPYTQEARGVARLLALDAFVSAHDAKGVRALEDVVGIFALSDALRGEPTIISQLVRIAIHAMGCDTAVRLAPAGLWNDEELKSLQIAIQAAQFKAEMARALEGERATMLSALENMPLGPLRQANGRETLRIFERSIDAYSESWADNLERQRGLSAELSAGARSQWTRLQMTGVQMMLPALEQGAVAGARAEARQKCAVAVIALQRYRLAHGRLPESLEEMKGHIPGAATEGGTALVDPFDGKPLRYKIEEARVHIYSVGENAIDDGGDIGFGATGASRPLDVGFSFPK
ncbi:MAG TPA: hypothetical protein VL475_06220 [Planctomycetaceae bacterium]|nr:hypothetical protein [Planctomycetaceae bacterium]